MKPDDKKYDCNFCTHRKVCKFRDTWEKDMLKMGFSCRYFLAFSGDWRIGK